MNVTRLRAATVGAGSLSVLLLGYLGYAFLPLSDSLGRLATASPWHWALGEGPLENGFDSTGIAIFISGQLILLVVGLIAVRQRSIRMA